MLGYLLSDDLMFTSRVTGTGGAVGVEVKVAKTVGELGNLLAGERPGCLLVDLQNPGLNIGDLMASLAAPRPFVVGFGSHVDTQTLQAARDAGCDLVLPRSKFVQELPGSLATWCGLSCNSADSVRAEG